MKNITPELIAKAKEAKSAEQLLEIAKENGVELTEEEAKTYFAQLGASGAVSDDDLDAVAGGSDCPQSSNIPLGAKVRVINGNKCEHCGSDVGIFVLNTNAGGTVGTSKKIVKCIGCNEVILSRPTNEQLEVL